MKADAAVTLTVANCSRLQVLKNSLLGYPSSVMIWAQGGLASCGLALRQHKERRLTLSDVLIGI